MITHLIWATGVFDNAVCYAMLVNQEGNHIPSTKRTSREQPQPMRAVNSQGAHTLSVLHAHNWLSNECIMYVMQRGRFAQPNKPAWAPPKWNLYCILKVSFWHLPCQLDLLCCHYNLHCSSINLRCYIYR